MARTYADALLDAVRTLNAAGVRYAISGGVAKALYGVPTFTKDLDLLVLADAERMAKLLQPTFRSLASDAYHDTSGYVVELYFARAPWELELLDRAELRQLDTERVPVLHPADWAALKLREARNVPSDADRHFVDVRAVDAVLPLDRDHVRRLAEAMGAAAEFRRAFR